MPSNPLKAFQDPVTRPRAIVWFGVLLIAVVLMTVAGLVGTSFEWFCTGPCHMVHDDNTLSYQASSHTNVSCMACHEPVDASPFVFAMMKVHVLPDLPATILGTYEVPVNPASHVAVEFPDNRCTQCHNLKTREVTPARGIIIDHEVHSENDVTCATCHNRVAHPEEDIDLVLGDRKHDNWMTMDACFRCHSLEPDAKAPGACAACHPKDFGLVPASHTVEGDWYNRYGESAGHAKAAREESASVVEAKELFAEHGEVDSKHAEGPVLEPASAVNTCFTCHKTTFCGDCHVLPMPHPEGFQANHGREGFAQPKACANCHARNAADARGTSFCNGCHHPDSSPGTPWQKQHPRSVISGGANACFDCHDPQYCETCHVSGPKAAAAFARNGYQ